ncbi:MAG: sodium:proton antiporter [Campylobacteraceae bacterium]|jgi:putative phosphoribosyl transferase|nr:sodium:proton antiporter [Campylobacteraceae bacterium]
MPTYRFESRLEAAEKIFEILPVSQMQDEDWVLLALSLDAVSITDYISRKSSLDYDILFNEPIFAPNNPSCIIAIVSENEEVVIQEALVESFGINLDFIYGEAKRKYEESILKNIYKYRKGSSLPLLTGRKVLLIDDGCESGMRAMVSLKTVIAEYVKSASFAAPIMAQNTALMLDNETDGLFCFSRVANFVSTDFYYKTKEEDLNCDEILKILESSKHYISFQKSQGDE